MRDDPVNCSSDELHKFLELLGDGYLPCVSSEPCTSSPVLEAGYLPTYYSGTSPSVQSKSMSIASRSYRRGKKTVVFHGFPFLQMSRSSTDGLGAGLLTWFLAVSRARTLAQPVRVQESTANDPACGGRWRELSVKYDRNSCSWRTHRSLWDEDLPESSVILPKWGSMRDGVLSELLTLEHPTAANDAGLWPTPTVPNGGRSCAHVTDWRGRTTYHNGKKVQVGMEHAAKHWPTPTVSGNNNRRGASAKSGDGLSTAVKTWPTPTVNDSKNCTLPPSQMKHDNIPGALLRDGEKAGGELNPTWVEWLMNWPLGWTSLEPIKHDNWKYWQESSAAYFQSNGLREMWFDRDPSTPPQGQEFREQHTGECGNPLPAMSQDRSHAGRNVGTRESGIGHLQGLQSGIPTEAHTPIFDMQQTMSIGMGPNQCREALEYVPRVTNGVIARVDRLKAIGNGQVPGVAALAWRILTSQRNS